ncbi:histidine phosphatase family protein [Microbacterium sp. ZW T5_56]|uniref:histidine phosphatase family protein n=1 Tax=Microbacterium sp. ZW T5_56 TaxID=3378081 RepID=UPI0038534301
MTLITLVRHGQTDWNLARRIQGSTDIPLNDTGRRQAREAAAELTVGDPVLLISSDLSRAEETAQIIGAARGWTGPATFAALRERNYGVAEGMTDTELVTRFGSWHTAEIPDAEPREQVAERALRALTEIAASVDEGTHIVAVSHGGVIGSLLRHLTGEPLPSLRIANGSAHTLRVQDGTLRVHEPHLLPVG